MYHLVQPSPVNNRTCSPCNQKLGVSHRFEGAQGNSFPREGDREFILLPLGNLPGLFSSDHMIIFKEVWTVQCHQLPWDTAFNDWWPQVNVDSSHVTLQASLSVWMFDLETHPVWSYMNLLYTRFMEEPGLSLGHSWSSNLEVRWMGQVSTTWRQGPALIDMPGINTAKWLSGFSTLDTLKHSTVVILLSSQIQQGFRHFLMSPIAGFSSAPSSSIVWRSRGKEGKQSA